MSDPASPPAISELTVRQCYVVLIAAFLGWLFSGLQIQLFVLIHREAMLSILTAGVTPGTPPSAEVESAIKLWFAWYQAAFLFGAAAGGWVFGIIGDRWGRTRALGLSILCYSVFTGACYFADSPYQLLILRFLACHGIGGAWPNTMALVPEAWPRASRPFLAGLLGTAANIGQVLMAFTGLCFDITATSWKWVLLVGASPAIIGLWCLWGVPESVKWLQSRQKLPQDQSGPLKELFGPSLLSRTMIGILLGAVPVIGTAANAQWIVPWTDHVAAEQRKLQTAEAQKQNPSAKVVSKKPDPKAKARTAISRSGGAVVGSLLGGILAALLGRRLTYFLISLLSLGASTLIFGWLDPTHPWFITAAFGFGVVGTIYFGWLPLFPPELFPTRVRATGMGISFNTGRIVAGCVTLVTAVVLTQYKVISYSQIGLWTGMIYVAGMLVILFAPRTDTGALKD